MHDIGPLPKLSPDWLILKVAWVTPIACIAASQGGEQFEVILFLLIRKDTTIVS